MQVVMCHEYGGPETLVVEEIPVPEPGPGEVRVRLHARGVSYTDVRAIPCEARPTLHSGW